MVDKKNLPRPFGRTVDAPITFVDVDDQSQPQPLKPTNYWLGEPSKYMPGRMDLDGLPDEDAGGREFALPPDMSPADLFDHVAPLLMMLNQQALRGQGPGQPPPAPALLVQGIQMVWIFASQEIMQLKEQVAELQHELDALKGGVPKEAGQEAPVGEQ